MSLFFYALHRERVHFNCRSLVIGLSATLSILLLSAAALAADLPLTLANAQRLAVERSRQVSAQESALVAAQQMAVAAGQLPDPVVTSVLIAGLWMAPTASVSGATISLWDASGSVKNSRAPESANFAQSDSIAKVTGRWRKRLLSLPAFSATRPWRESIVTTPKPWRR